MGYNAFLFLKRIILNSKNKIIIYYIRTTKTTNYFYEELLWDY